MIFDVGGHTIWSTPEICANNNEKESQNEHWPKEKLGKCLKRAKRFWVTKNLIELVTILNAEKFK